MRMRWTLILLLACVGFTFFACSKPAASPSDASGPNSNTGASAPATPATTTSAPSDQQQPSSAPAQPEAVVIPAGTSITVRLSDAVGSKISQPGQSFTGTLSHSIAVEGNRVVPAGASVAGIVEDAKPLGHFKGGALLQLKLTSVRIHDADKEVQTSALTMTKKGKGKRSAILAGGGAGLGALIGGLAGGGKGAAIGAVAGGGAGTAGAAYTGNDEIVLPAESVLTFKLTHSVHVE